MKKHIFRLLILVLLLIVTILLIIKFTSKSNLSETPKTGFVASDSKEVTLYDSEYNESLKLTRGSKVYVYSSKITNEDVAYKKVEYNKEEYFVNINNIVENSEDGLYKGIREIIKNKKKFDGYKKSLEGYSYPIDKIIKQIENLIEE